MKTVLTALQPVAVQCRNCRRALATVAADGRAWCIRCCLWTEVPKQAA